MCGIAGYIGSKKFKEDELAFCLNLMKHRGPDAQNLFTENIQPNKNIQLLHARLSIIDRGAESNQPFIRGDCILIFNGEIYNYLEIREKLKKIGVNFFTNSDTEVLLAALQEWGIDGLKHLEGMWAFAMYNRATKRLILSRDRFGEKPLYISMQPDGLYFGSEIKFIQNLLNKKLKINNDQINRYLFHGYRSLNKNNQSFFEEITKLDAGTVLEIDQDGSKKVHKFFQPRYLQDSEMSYGSAVEGVRDRLIDAVKLRLRADVPLAFCMSGGVDSNALISIAKKEFNYDVHGFTIVNTDSRYEEATVVERVVTSLGIKHTGVKLTSQGFLPNLKALIKSHDAPISTISYYVHWQLMQHIHNSGFKISISGTGADEIFSGYYDHYNAYLYEIKDLNIFKNEFNSWDKFIKPLIRNNKISEWDFYFKNPEYREHLYYDRHEFGKYFKKEFNENFKENNYSADLLRNRMANELYEEVVPVILNEDDLNAMYFSIENRSPFLDSNLIEFCNTIPTKLLIKNGYNKSILRDAMIHIVPEFILNNRNKIGFNAPIVDLLGTLDEKDMQEILSENPVFKIIDKRRIKDLLLKKNHSNSESKFIFNFLNIKYFYEEFL